ncbi:MAG: hypothetical protein HY423_09765 [Candidatus Lambdaproteobacteria bacterium]|nr:hypothetical protein [Candidatus Lambdaproteobacteria bacterium]
MEDLPLVITPHPLNDLTQEQVRELARAAYPLILADLTQQGPIPREAYVDYVHPGARSRQVQQQARAQAAQSAPRAR